MPDPFWGDLLLLDVKSGGLSENSIWDPWDRKNLIFEPGFGRSVEFQVKPHFFVKIFNFGAP